MSESPAPADPAADAPAADRGEMREIRKLRREAAGWRSKLRETERKLAVLEGQLVAYRELSDAIARRPRGHE